MIFKVSFQHKPFYDSMIVPRMEELGLPGSSFSTRLTAITMCWGDSDFHMDWKHFV